MLSRQEVFEKAVKAIIKQGSQCYDEEQKTCLYRHQGKACVIGQLIPDEKYMPLMDSSGDVAGNLPVQEVLKEEGIDVSEEGLDFLWGLQRVHDGSQPTHWKDEFMRVGVRWGLNVDFLRTERVSND